VEYYQEIADALISETNPHQPLKMVLSQLSSSEPDPDTDAGAALIHCSFGKDRTGVLCAIILSLAGVDDDIVAQEYALTTEGIREKVVSIIAEIRPGGPGITIEEERFFSAR